jgi:hypothetical protein
MRPPKSPELASESTLAWWRCPGLVYFLAVGMPVAAVKIGMLAITPKTNLKSAIVRRLSSIQSSNHELIELLGVVHFKDSEYPTRDAEDLERKLHIEFQHLARFKAGSRGAEWFTSSPELLVRIKSLADSPESLGLPRHVGVLIEKVK